MFQLSHVCYLGALASVGGRVLGGDGSHCVGVGLEAVEMNHLFRTFLIRYIAVWPVPGKVPSKAGDFSLGTVAILYPLVQMGSHGSCYHIALSSWCPILSWTLRYASSRLFRSCAAYCVCVLL